MVKNLPAKGGATGDAVLIFGSERSPGGGNGNPLQYFHLENPMDKKPWRATVHGIAKSHIWLSEHKHTTSHILPVIFIFIICPRLGHALVRVHCICK